MAIRLIENTQHHEVASRSGDQGGSPALPWHGAAILTSRLRTGSRRRGFLITIRTINAPELFDLIVPGTASVIRERGRGRPSDTAGGDGMTTDVYQGAPGLRCSGSRSLVPPQPLGIEFRLRPKAVGSP